MPRTTAAQKPAAQTRAAPVRATQREADTRDFPTHARVVEMAEDPAQFEGIEPVKALVMDEAEALAFAEEPLQIVIHQTGEKNPEDPVYVSVNGRGGFIKRGQVTIVKRKYVERLILAKADNVNQDTSARTEQEFNRLTIVPTQRYPLSIVKDDSPNAKKWLESMAHMG